MCGTWQPAAAPGTTGCDAPRQGGCTRIRSIQPAQWCGDCERRNSCCANRSTCHPANPCQPTWCRTSPTRISPINLPRTAPTQFVPNVPKTNLSTRANSLGAKCLWRQLQCPQVCLEVEGGRGVRAHQRVLLVDQLLQLGVLLVPVAVVSYGGC